MSATAIGLLAGLVAALCFGLGDFVAQSLTRQRGWLVASLAVQIVSVLALVTIGPIWPGLPARFDQAELALALGTANTLGIVALYRAFELGKLSLVSPIAGSMGAFTLIFAWLAGETPPALVLPGLAFVLVGIALAGVAPPSDEPQRPRLTGSRGLGWALISAIAFGWVFLRLGDLADALGSTWSVLALRVVAIPWLLVVAGLMRTPLRDRPGEPERPPLSRTSLVAVALLDTSGLLALSLGGELGQASVAAVLASAFPLVTIALARVRLREQLAWWQWLGVTAILVGVAWLGTARE